MTSFILFAVPLGSLGLLDFLMAYAAVAGAGTGWRAGVRRAGDPQVTIECPPRMSGEVLSLVDRDRRSRA